MNCKDIIKSGNYEVMITDDADVLHESVISENKLSPHCKNDPTTIINEYDENNSLPSLSGAIDCTLNAKDNYKDALLAALFSQVEFLRNELNEKNLLIRTLIIRESDVYNYPVDPSQNRLLQSSSSSPLSLSNGSSVDISKSSEINLVDNTMGYMNEQDMNEQDMNVQDMNVRDINVRDINVRDMNVRDMNVRDMNVRDMNVQDMNVRGMNVLDMN